MSATFCSKKLDLLLSSSKQTFQCAKRSTRSYELKTRYSTNKNVDVRKFHGTTGFLALGNRSRTAFYGGFPRSQILLRRISVARTPYYATDTRTLFFSIRHRNVVNRRHPVYRAQPQRSRDTIVEQILRTWTMERFVRIRPRKLWRGSHERDILTSFESPLPHLSRVTQCIIASIGAVV